MVLVAPGSAGGSGAVWQEGAGDLGLEHLMRAFGSLDPTADRVALVDGDPGAGTEGRLVVDSIDGRDGRPIRLERAAEAPPAWLPDGRVILVVRDRSDQPRPVVADLSTGRLSTLGDPLRSVAIAGRTVAVIDDDGSVQAGSLVDWLAGTKLPVLVTTTALGERGPIGILQAVPSPAGDDLALVVADANGDAAEIRLLSVDGGHEIARFDLPRGANRAVVGWLGAP